jgi:hypothetical protein
MSPLNLFFDNGLVFFGFDLPVNLALPPLGGDPLRQQATGIAFPGGLA